MNPEVLEKLKTVADNVITSHGGDSRDASTAKVVATVFAITESNQVVLGIHRSADTKSCFDLGVRLELMPGSLGDQEILYDSNYRRSACENRILSVVQDTLRIITGYVGGNYVLLNKDALRPGPQEIRYPRYIATGVRLESPPPKRPCLSVIDTLTLEDLYALWREGVFQGLNTAACLAEGFQHLREKGVWSPELTRFKQSLTSALQLKRASYNKSSEFVGRAYEAGRVIGLNDEAIEACRKEIEASLSANT